MNSFIPTLPTGKTIGWYCHIAGQQQLGAQQGLLKVSSGANLAPVSALFVQQVHLLQGTQVTVAHSPVTNKVDCCEEVYSFTNRCLSRGTWAPAKSGGDHWHNLHVPHVQTQ
jgi:hypothetical protein